MRRPPLGPTGLICAIVLFIAACASHAPVAKTPTAAPPVAAAPAPETAKKTSKTKAAKATKPAEPTRKTASEDEAASAAGPGSLDDLEAAAASTASEPAAPVEMSEPAPAQVAAPEEAPMMEATPEAAPESAPVEAPKKAPKNSKKSKVAKAEKKSGAKGKFANTKTECPLLREPASDSEKMIVVKAPRKIWVEEVDGSWVRAFNKAGEPGYVSTECFE